MKLVRTVFGSILVIAGIIFTILPGSFLLVLGGLVLLSMDFPLARKFLNRLQKTMYRAARKLDLMILNRKYK
jgi:hypothetical protein